MTKKQFLNELEAKLNILNKEEMEDIINEYKDIIEEKIRNGKTVKEAIADFGDIDELTSEILKAYKINPNYNKKENNKINDTDAYKKIEGGIKKIARKLAQITNQLFEEVKTNYDNITVEKVFELLIKFFILMLVLMLLKLPFHFLYNAGTYILDLGYNPIGQMISFAWKIVIWTVYLVGCITLVVVFTHNQLKELNNDSGEKRKDNNKKKETNELVKSKETENSKDVVEEKIDKAVVSEKKSKNKEKKSNYGVLRILGIIIGIMFLFPILMANIGLYFTLVVTIYFIIKGIQIYGILIAVIGLIVIFGYLYHMLYNLMFCRKRVLTFPLIIGVVLVTIGGLLTVEYAASLKYYDNLPSLNISPKTMTYKEEFTGELYILNAGLTSNPILVVDNNLKDREIIIEISYYNEYTSINEHSLYIYSDNYDDNSIENTYLGIHHYEKRGFRKITSDVIERFKNREIYNYQNLFKADMKISVNQNTIELINK